VYGSGCWPPAGVRWQPAPMLTSDLPLDLASEAKSPDGEGGRDQETDHGDPERHDPLTKLGRDAVEKPKKVAESDQPEQGARNSQIVSHWLSPSRGARPARWCRRHLSLHSRS